MKNLFFIAIATMMALSSCSENEVFTTAENSKTPITIDVYQQGQTRVTETTIDILQTSGFKFVVMNGTASVINANATYAASKWSYDGSPAYWPTEGNPTYTFYGFYSPNASDVFDAANDKATINVDGASDVVFASVSAQEPANGAAVALPFKHVMAKFTVSAKGMNDGLTYTVTNITFTAPATIDYKLSDGTLTPANTTADRVLLNNTTGGVDAAYDASNYTPMVEDADMLILPTCAMTMTIKYTVGATGETPKDFTKTASIPAVTAGTVNRINVTLPSERTPISFSISSVEGWSTTENNYDPALQ